MKRVRQVTSGKWFKDLKTEAEARELAKVIEAKGSIGIFNYCRPRLYLNKLTPEEMVMLKEWKVAKYGNHSVQIQAREQLRPLLDKIKQYLGSAKQEQANAALDLLDFIEKEPTYFEKWTTGEFCQLQELLKKVRGQRNKLN
jgi:hypothetical protein